MVNKRFPFRLINYILREVFPYFFFTLITLTFLILIQQISRQADILANLSNAFGLTVRSIILLIPGILVITLPFSLLIGAIISLNRLSADSEIIAARAGGVSIWSLAVPFIMLGILCGLISGSMTIYVVPYTYHNAQSLKRLIVQELIKTSFQAQIFNNQFPDHLIHIKDIDNDSGDWKGVFIVQKKDDRNSLVLTSDRARLRVTNSSPLELEISLFNGLLSTYSDNMPERQNTIRFNHQEIRLADESSRYNPAADNAKAYLEMSMDELKKASLAVPQTEQRQFQIEWHRRLSLPFACLVLAVLAIPIGLETRRHGGRAFSFALGFGIALIYYLFLLAGQNLVLSNVLPPWVGLWLPNILGLIAGLSQILKPISFSIPQKRRATSFFNKGGVVASRTPNASHDAALSSVLKQRRYSLFLSIIDYLLVSEFIKYVALSLFVLVGTILVFTLFDIIPSLSKSGLGWKYAFIYLFYLAPQIIYIIFPFGVLISFLTTHSILSRSNQLTALLVSGQSLNRLFLPILTITLIIIGALLWVSDFVLPSSNRQQDMRYNIIKGRKNEQSIMALGNKWVQTTNGQIFSYQYDHTSNTLLNTTVYKLSSGASLLDEIIYASQASAVGAQEWAILSGWRYSYSDNTYQTLLPNELSLLVPEGNIPFSRVVNEASKMRFNELRNYVRYLSRLGANTTSLRVDLEKKIAFPFSCLPLIVLALSITAGNHRRGALAGVGLSIIIGFTFWIAASFFESLGRQAYLSPGLAVWSPQLIYLALGIYVIFKKRT